MAQGPLSAAYGKGVGAVAPSGVGGCGGAGGGAQAPRVPVPPGPSVQGPARGDAAQPEGLHLLPPPQVRGIAQGRRTAGGRGREFHFPTTGETESWSSGSEEGRTSSDLATTAEGGITGKAGHLG